MKAKIYTVVQVITERNLIELLDEHGTKFYWKGGIDTKFSALLAPGIRVSFFDNNKIMAV